MRLRAERWPKATRCSLDPVAGLAASDRFLVWRSAGARAPLGRVLTWSLPHEEGPGRTVRQPIGHEARRLPAGRRNKTGRRVAGHREQRPTRSHQ